MTATSAVDVRIRISVRKSASPLRQFAREIDAQTAQTNIPLNNRPQKGEELQRADTVNNTASNRSFPDKSERLGRRNHRAPSRVAAARIPTRTHFRVGSSMSPPRTDAGARIRNAPINRNSRRFCDETRVVGLYDAANVFICVCIRMD